MKRLDSYSQNFLTSPRLVAELVGHSNIRKKDLVLDIGAGSGVISSVLARRASRVVAIEADKRILKKLRQNLSRFKSVEIVAGDFLRYCLPSEDYKVFANPPFHLSSKIVKKLTFAKNQPKSIYLVLQKQFAKKLIMNEANFTSQLGASISPWWQARIRRPLKKTDFYPRPNVDTVLLEIKRRKEEFLSIEYMSDFYEFTAQCFADQKYFSELKQKYRISTDKKASEFDTEEWCELFLAIRYE